ncbi:MAG: restriction endonuclease subunit S [Candidatus Methanoperedens sp.]
MEAHERRALPEGWEWKNLENICKVKGGYAFKSDEYTKTGIPVIRISNFDNGELDITNCVFINSNILNQFDEYKLTDDDILIAMSGATTGKIGIVKQTKKPLLLNQRVGKFSIFNECLYNKFLYYFVNGEFFKKEVLKFASGCAQPNISSKQIESIQIPLPPLPTQRRIVSILEKAEETKKLRAQADELTDRLLQSVFLEMFGDPVRNQKGWKKYTFKDIIQEFRYGTSIKSSEGGYPVLRIPNVLNGKINLNELKYCNVTISEYEKIRLQKGDVLFVRTNGNQDYVGRCAIVEKNQEDFIFASYLIRAKLKQEIISPYYLKNYLFTGYGKNLMKSKTKTTAGQFNINTQGLGALEILLPPLPLQQKFARIVEKVDSMCQSQNQSKQQIEDLFSALMQKAFRGEI